MSDLILFEKVNKQLIWGQEDWLISAHQNGETKVKSGKYQGMTLTELFETQKQLFGNIKANQFPLLVKIIDAKQDLSIQVHPNDEYALKNENSLGKTECWYILDSQKDTTIINGHHAKNKQELIKAITKDKISDYLNQQPINKGDFIYIPAGTVHAIKANTKLLEIQQTSDVTYRVYDYQRTDANGNQRELHLDKAIDVITYQKNHQQSRIRQEYSNYVKETLIETKYFNVYKIETKEEVTISNEYPFLIGIVLSQKGIINNQLLEFGQAFIIPNKTDITIAKDVEVIISHI